MLIRTKTVFANHHGKKFITKPKINPNKSLLPPEKFSFLCSSFVYLKIVATSAIIPNIIIPNDNK